MTEGREQAQEQEQLSVTRTVSAARDYVFSVWVDPEKIPLWWGAGPVTCPEAEVDLRPGGRYRIANKTPDGTIMWITGEYLVIEPPSHLRYTWAMEPVTEESNHSLVDVTFTEVADGTQIVVAETKIADPATRQMHLDGWVGCLDGLDRLLG